MVHPWVGQIRLKRNVIRVLVGRYSCLSGTDELGGGTITPRLCFVLPEVRECIRDANPRTNTTRGGRGARHSKTTLPHRPPGR